MKQMYDLDLIRFNKIKLPTVDEIIKAQEKEPIDSMGTFVSSCISQKNGRILDRKTEKGHSFVIGFLALLLAKMGATTLVTDLKQVGGNLVNPTNDGFNLDSTEIIGSLTTGIICGTGTTPVSVVDSDIETIIPEGGGAGQFNYLACTVGQLLSNASQVFFNITRDMQNNSGGQITSTENVIRSNTTPGELITDRTLVTDVVNDTQTLTKTFTPIITV